MQEHIELALQPLLGQPLTDIGRAGLTWFAFGSNRVTIPDQSIIHHYKGGKHIVSDYALHVQCPWRILGPQGIVVGSGDLYYPSGNPQREVPDEELNKQNDNRCNELIKLFLEQTQNRPPTVTTIQVDTVGSLKINLTGGYSVEIFPDDTTEDEFWRFFRPARDEDHLVVTNQGIENG